MSQKEWIPKNFSTGNYSTAMDENSCKIDPTIFNKAIKLIGVDFAKAEQAVLAFMQSPLTPSLVASWRSSRNKAFRLKSNLKLRRPQFMTEEEINIQKALGTLPYKEYMKLKGILFENDWWFFPIVSNKKCKKPSLKLFLKDDQKYYPVADAYIKDLYYSLSHNKYTEEKFADEIISQCYSCMLLATINH